MQIFPEIERDIRHGMTVPPSLSMKSAVEMLSHPRWLYRYLTSPAFEMANVVTSPTAAIIGDQTLLEYVSTQFNRNVTWDDAACMIGRPYLYALAAGGEKGIDKLMALLCSELERDMALLGCNNISNLNANFIRTTTANKAIAIAGRAISGISLPQS